MMIKLKSILILALMFVGGEAFSLQISLDNPPSDYRVFRLRGRNLGNLTYAQDYNKFSFNIPKDYIINNSDGSPNLIASLRNWRRNTPIADGNPRTRNGIGYYPFKDSSGRNRYIALEHIYNNRPDVVKVHEETALSNKEPKVEIDLSPRSSSVGETVSSVTTNESRLNPADLARQVEANSSAQDEVEIDLNPSTGNELASSLRPVARPEGLAGVPGIFKEEFPPRTASFSTSRNTADSYTNAEWENMSYTQKAEYMGKKYDELLRAHGFRDTYSPEVLVCKSYKESTFNPQIRTSASNSTAAGISQITRSTARDTFSRGGWFRSKVEGFTNIRNGGTFYERMAGSMTAQMEFGMAILEQKRRDNRLSSSSSNINVILQRYYGSSSASANRAYARNILECADCIESSGYSKRCLDKVY